MWIAWVASETKMPRFLLALFLGFMGIGAGLGLYQHLTYQDFPYAPYQDLLDYVMEEESTLIVHSNKLSFLPAVYYAPELKQNYVADKKGGADTLAIATQKVLGLLAEPSVEAAVGDADRVCFIIFEQSIEEYQEIGYLTHPHLEWLESNYSLEDKTYWNDLALFTFVRTQE